MFMRHHLMMMPVVDAAGRVKGVVSVNDIVDVVQEEATEDIHKIGGVETIEGPYLQVPLSRMIRKRAGWLTALFIGEMLTASAMGYFEDSIARGRDYYMPYRVLLPRKVDNLLVAGRHYSASSQAQKISREIPPCMAMGEAAGVAAALALNAGVRVRDVDVGSVQKALRAQGADPGDQSGRNADIPALAAYVPQAQAA